MTSQELCQILIDSLLAEANEVANPELAMVLHGVADRLERTLKENERLTKYHEDHP